MKSRMRRNLRFVLAFVVLLMSSALAFSAAALAATPQYGEKVVFALPYSITTFNPNYDYEGASVTWLAMNVFNKLVGYDYATGGYFPDLARTWTVSPNGRTYTFHLEKKAKWHDGKPFTAADVKWTIDSIIKEKGYNQTNLKEVSSVQVVDDNTVVIQLSDVNAAFISVLSGIYILPKHLYEGSDPRKNPHNLNAVGTGPFKVGELVPDSHVFLDANKEYFRGRPYLDRIIIRVIRSLTTQIAALEAGEIDHMLSSPPPQQVDRLKKAGFEVSVQKLLTMAWIGFNMDRPYFADQRVRRAIAMAVDVDEIMRRVYLGFAKGTRNVYTSAVPWAFNPDAKQPAYNPAEAERLLNEAGWPRKADGVRFRTKIITYTVAIYGTEEINLLIREYLRKVGIEVELERIEFALFTQRVLRDRNVEMSPSGGNHGPDPSEYYQMVGSTGGRNFMGYKNAEVDRLLNEARRTLDQKERAKKYFRVQEIVAQDMPRLNIFEHVWIYIYKPGLAGWWWEPAQRGKEAGYNDYRTLHWVK